MSISSLSICFIGGGNMARSLIGGLIARGQAAASIHVAEPYAPLREKLAHDFGVHTYANNEEAAKHATLWIFAVKPQVMKAVCQNLAALAQIKQPLIVSIAAGITSVQLERWLGGKLAVVRTMPNTPALLGAGASGLFANHLVSDEQRVHADRMLQATGLTVWIDDEQKMDAVTALSGSGPAYVFLLAEALQLAGEKQGLTSEIARSLTAQTMLGAARMLLETGESAAELRQHVTSPGGTTQAALEIFENGGFRALVDQAVAAATQRGGQLSAAND